jgi:hypothetical protein
MRELRWGAVTNARILDWYRTDAGPRMRRILIAGPAFLSLGGLVVAVSFAAREPPAVRSLSAVVGLAMVAGSVTFTLASMSRILREDAYLAIRTDAVVFKTRAGERIVAWDDLVGVRWEAARGELWLERAAGDPMVVAARFARVTGAELAERIERARRRAAMGMLERD